MSESCTHNCDTCGASCSSRDQGAADSMLEKPHELSSIKNVIGVVSGKGGVGKSLVSSMLAVEMSRRGYSVGILDADVTGPSIPRVFGLSDKAGYSDEGFFPSISRTGIQVMSINLLLQHDSDPVVWRGPMIAGIVRQFWTDTVWKDVDFLFVDMPPGTGDVPLTVFQSMPLNGIVVVTSPQDLVGMIVSKAVRMAELMNIPVVGMVENYSYLKCPDCGKEISLFGESRAEETAKKHGIRLLDRLPLDPRLAAACDKGAIEFVDLPYLSGAADAVENLCK